MKKILYIAISLLGIEGVAQNLSYDFYTYRLNNMYNINPAYTGKDDGMNIILSAQSQNKGVAFANKNFMLGLHSKISSKQAIGGKMIYDYRGAFQNIKADLTYAYIAKINDAQKLSLGLSAGVYNNSINTSKIEGYERLDYSDPTLSNNYYNQTQFSAGVGLLYTLKGLDVSLSLPHIITTSQPLNSYFNGSVFYTIKAGNKFKITPWVSYQNIPVTKSVTSFMLKTAFKDLVWIQLGYQTNKSINMALGLNYENISLGYGYRMSNKEFNGITTGMQEITLGYRIIKNNSKKINITASESMSLADIAQRLMELADQPVTDSNKADIKAQLQALKQSLKKAEVDNSTPEKAAEVSKQLQQIDEKLKIIEKNLIDAK